MFRLIHCSPSSRPEHYVPTYVRQALKYYYFFLSPYLLNVLSLFSIGLTSRPVPLRLQVNRHPKAGGCCGGGILTCPDYANAHKRECTQCTCAHSYTHAYSSNKTAQNRFLSGLHTRPQFGHARRQYTQPHATRGRAGKHPLHSGLTHPLT